MSKYLQLRTIFIVIGLLLSGQAAALTIYDVIQLSTKQYTDKDIITLIEVTDSAFELKADDIPRLLELGVSETVIQTMLKAVPGKAEEHPTPLSNAVNRANEDKPKVQNMHAIIAGGRFSFNPFNETGAGHHDHQVINLAGVKLLVIRHSGNFVSIKSRAAAVVKRLEHAVSAGKGHFRPGTTKEGKRVMFYPKNTSQPIPILNITLTDARSYARRSGREVTPALLAAYWSGLLSDYWAITINDHIPVQLTDIHEGEALSDLYEQWIKPPVIATARLNDVARLLPGQSRKHLLHLATRVPHDFVVEGTISLGVQP